MHWSCGDIGYFPTYTLGDLYSAQFYCALKKEIPDIEEKLASGDTKTLREWLREKIHKIGKTQTPHEITLRVTGESLNPDYLINFLKERYSSIYSLKN